MAAPKRRKYDIVSRMQKARSKREQTQRLPVDRMLSTSAVKEGVTGVKDKRSMQADEESEGEQYSWEETKEPDPNAYIPQQEEDDQPVEGAALPDARDLEAAVKGNLHTSWLVASSGEDEKEGRLKEKERRETAGKEDEKGRESQEGIELVEGEEAAGKGKVAKGFIISKSGKVECRAAKDRAEEYIRRKKGALADAATMTGSIRGWMSTKPEDWSGEEKGPREAQLPGEAAQRTSETNLPAIDEEDERGREENGKGGSQGKQGGESLAIKENAAPPLDPSLENSKKKSAGGQVRRPAQTLLQAFGRQASKVSVKPAYEASCEAKGEAVGNEESSASAVQACQRVSREQTGSEAQLSEQGQLRSRVVLLERAVSILELPSPEAEASVANKENAAPPTDPSLENSKKKTAGGQIRRPAQTLFQAFGRQKSKEVVKPVYEASSDVKGEVVGKEESSATAVQAGQRGSREQSGSEAQPSEQEQLRSGVVLPEWAASIFEPLSPEAEVSVAGAIFVTRGIIYERGLETLLVDDLRRLQSCAFLRDEVIDIVGVLLRQVVSDVRVLPIMVFNNLREDGYVGPARGVWVDPEGQRLWMFPVNVNNCHWVLLSVDLVANIIGYHDSMRDQNLPPPGWAIHVGIIVDDWRGYAASWRSVTVVTGQQTSRGNDCAIAVIHNMLALALRQPTLCTPGRYTELRKRVFMMVLQYSLVPDESAVGRFVAEANQRLRCDAVRLPIDPEREARIMSAEEVAAERLSRGPRLRKRGRAELGRGTISDDVILQQVPGYEHEHVGYTTSTIPNAGLGLFVTRKLRGGQFICGYPGVRVTVDEIMSAEYESKYLSAHGEDSDVIIDAKDPKWGHGRLANDSMANHLNNAEIRRGTKGYGLYVLRDSVVDSRSEVFVAYGGEFFIDASFDCWLREAAAVNYPEHAYRILHIDGEGDCDHSDCRNSRRRLMQDWEHRIMRDGDLKNFIPRLVQKRNVKCRRSEEWDCEWRMHGDGSSEAKPLERSKRRRELMELDSFSAVYCSHDACRVEAVRELKRKRELDVATIDELWSNRLCRQVRPCLESKIGPERELPSDLG